MPRKKTPTIFPTFSICSNYYKPEEVEELIKEVKEEYLVTKTLRRNNETVKIRYYNIPAAFDIETSSFYQGENKQACMYEWTLGIYGRVMIGRTWDDFIDVISKIVEKLELCYEKRLVIYVHNLAYEFQWICKYFEWEKVFALSQRKPVQAVTTSGIEFKCSYILSGHSLSSLGGQLTKYKAQKMSGDLDYSLIRHTKTPLTEKELSYCYWDVQTVMCYIMEKIEQDGDITKIPLTKTGYVRRYIKQCCMYTSKSHKKDKWKYVRYHKMMRALTIEPDEFKQMLRAFQGGFTHACAFQVGDVSAGGRVHKDVGSIDFTSSYPYQIVSSREFPISKGERVEVKSLEQFKYLIKNYACIFDVEIIGLQSIVWADHPLSKSRCSKVQNCVEDNGRIVSADYLITTLTNIDWNIITKFYSMDKIRVGMFYKHYKGYLPTDLVKGVLQLYSDKTTLKGVEGREVDYMLAKGNLNACYGMMVTNPCRPENNFVDGEWKDPVQPDINFAMDKYNEAKGRFLYYGWGVFITALARYALFSGIYEFGVKTTSGEPAHDYIYADTDSIKAVNMKNHVDYIEKYNAMVRSKLEDAMQHHGIDFEMCEPSTIKGEKKLIGVWDNEGNSDFIAYERFKTLGAKRYMVMEDGKINITVSGLNKRVTVPYLMKEYETPDEVFKAFNTGLYIPAEHTGKNTHTYIDYPMEGLITDYQGNTAEYHELSGVHLQPADYSMSLTKAYIDFLLGVKEGEEVE